MIGADGRADIHTNASVGLQMQAGDVALGWGV